MGNHQRFAYVTLTDNDQYAMGVLSLAKSLQMTNTRYPLIVLVSSNVSVISRELMKNAGCLIQETALFPVPNSFPVMMKRWVNAFTKFYAFDLDLDCIVWLDSDTLVTANIDGLFNLNTKNTVIAAIEPNTGSCEQKATSLNSGVMIFKPGKSKHNQIRTAFDFVAGLLSDGVLNFANDQEVLQYAFPDWIALPYPKYGGYVSQCDCPQWVDISIAHYTAGKAFLPKPWSWVQNKSQYNLASQCLTSVFRRWEDTFNH
ncbi:xylan alpha-glucuronosyltransferase [Pelomyxa schiedti]|nr:xylan alpha-glucuronosyltransferase [Pelomyxa schiedti]